MASFAYSPLFTEDARSNSMEYATAYEQHNKMVEPLAKEMDVFFVDLEKQMPDNKEYWPDGRHTTFVGAQTKAEIIAAYIDEINIIPEESARPTAAKGLPSPAALVDKSPIEVRTHGDRR